MSEYDYMRSRHADLKRRFNALEKENRELKKDLNDSNRKLRWGQDRIEGLETQNKKFDSLCFQRAIEIRNFRKALKEILAK